MVNLNVIGRLGADAEKINGKNGQFLSFRPLLMIGRMVRKQRHGLE